MINPQTLSIQDYTYVLPEEKIAAYPLAQRDASKLLIYKDGQITTSVFKNSGDYIPSHSLLVFNNTKVVEARLLFQKPSGGTIEIFCLEPGDQYPDVTTAMMQQGKVLWKCLIGGASKWKSGQLLEKRIQSPLSELTITAKYIEKRSDHFVIELSWGPSSLSFAEVLHYAGAIPLPPYIKRTAEITDKDRYQTVYAQPEGSVAAPTAGLHFTDKLLKELNNRNIRTSFVTLHVGAGTFKPVKAEKMVDHDMHSEFIEVDRTFIYLLINNIDTTIIATGTTSLRTIESLYWLGVKIKKGIFTDGSIQLALNQWEPYELDTENIAVKESLQALLKWMDSNYTDRLIAKTKIIIAPGYKLKIAKALITNFHQPQSTLLLLVAALIGDDWRKVYDYALSNDFRFLSYGDGSLLFANAIPA